MENRNSLVSVITPAFNSSRFIRASIESVRAQTYSQWEMIVVDDNSVDDTSAIVLKYAASDGRIRLIRLNKNCGPAVARNAALDTARGRFIAFLDSDDLWLPEKLEHQVHFMEEHNIAFSYTLYRHMSEAGDRIGDLLTLPSTFNYSQLLKHTGIGCLTVMIDREKTGRLQMQAVHRQDYVLWLSLLKRGFQAHCLHEDLARYRISSGSVSRGKIKAAARVWHIYRNIEKLRLPYAAWCFVNYAWRAVRKYMTL